MAKRVFAWIGLGLLLAGLGYYQWSEGTADARRLSSGNAVEVRISSGAAQIIGGASADVRVTIDGVSDSLAANAKVHIDRARQPVLIEISGLPRHARAVVAVPESANLVVSMLAGDLSIRGVRGDVRALLRAGQMTIDAGATAHFASADGFVLAGDLNAQAFHVETGGLWRGFHWSDSGNSRLNAHVTSGELIIE